MSRASGRERARRSSLEPTRVSPARAGGQRLAKIRSGAGGAGQAVVDVDPVGVDTEPFQAIALDGEVLFDGPHTTR